MKKVTLGSLVVFFSAAVVAQNFGIDQPSPQQKLDVNGNIRMTGNTFVTNGSNSNYGAMTVQGENGGWGGINFRRANGTNLGTFMIQEDYSGVYNNTDNNWDWYWVNGTLAAGNIAPERIRKPVWSGGCNYHGTAGGWNTYCNNSVDFNSAGSYLTANGSGTFTVHVAGYYRVSAWAITLQSGQYMHVIQVINGAVQHYGYNHNHNGGWQDIHLEQIWPMNVGDTFYVQYHNHNGYGFHSWNSSGYHSRLQVTYEGGL